MNSPGSAVNSTTAWPISTQFALIVERYVFFGGSVGSASSQ